MNRYKFKYIFLNSFEKFQKKKRINLIWISHTQVKKNIKEILLIYIVLCFESKIRIYIFF